jgi:hypothetical protein
VIYDNIDESWRMKYRWYRWRAAVGLGHPEQEWIVNNNRFYQGA